MITFNVKEVNHGFVEVDIPEGISEEKVNELVMVIQYGLNQTLLMNQ